jgi:hypothetical protein
MGKERSTGVLLRPHHPSSLSFYFLNYDAWTRDVTEFKEGAIGLPLLASAHYISVSNEIALLVSVLSQMDQSTPHPVSFMFF